MNNYFQKKASLV